jgi:hypothetical protein
VPGDEGLPAGERLIAVDPGTLSPGTSIGGRFVWQFGKAVFNPILNFFVWNFQIK